MERKKLIADLRKAAGLCGYMFHTGMEHRINTELKKMPALWLVPPELINTKGWNEGTKQYRVKMFLIEKCREHSSEWKEETWQKLEETLTGIYKTLSKEPHIRTITDMEYHPQEFTITNRGEISIAATCKVHMNF